MFFFIILYSLLFFFGLSKGIQVSANFLYYGPVNIAAIAC